MARSGSCVEVQDGVEGTFESAMAIDLNHTIVHVRDPAAAAAALADLLGRPAPVRYGPFHGVELDNGVTLDFMRSDGDPVAQHYAFLVSEAEFDRIFGRIAERGLRHWADPGRQQSGRINHNDGGRGVYWEDMDGHLLEIITRPYGSGSQDDR
jgi:catechol 2,3-dioxygenase-like lactoylglutathione lyase family enzyme